jgi:hypothetical protein
VTDAQDAKARLEAKSGVIAPMAEFAFVPKLPAAVTGAARSVGFEAPPVLLTLTPEDLVVKIASLKGASEGTVVEGSAAQITLPDGSTRTGGIKSVTSSGAASNELVVVIVPNEALGLDLAHSNLKVTLVEAATGGKVLGVPQGAVNSDSSGALSVIVAESSGRADAEPVLKRVPVTVGVAGVDLVEIRPVDADSIKAGDKVVISG